MSPLGRRRGPALRASIRRRQLAVSDHARTYSAEVIRSLGYDPWRAHAIPSTPLNSNAIWPHFPMCFCTFWLLSAIFLPFFSIKAILLASSLQLASKMPPSRHLVGHGRHKLPPRCLLGPKRPSKRPPRGPQEAPRGPQEAPKRLPRGPNKPQEAPSSQ